MGMACLPKAVVQHCCLVLFLLSALLASFGGNSNGGGVLVVRAQPVVDGFPDAGDVGGEAACTVCEGENAVIGAPDNEVQDPVVGDTVTCSELEERASQGTYNVLQCRIVQVYVPFSPF